jgi:hypothetical protein
MTTVVYIWKFIMTVGMVAWVAMVIYLLIKDKT